MVHFEVINEDSNLSSFMLLCEANNIICKVTSIDCTILNLGQLLASFVGDSCNGSHITIRYDRKVSSCVLTSMAICTCHATRTGEADLINEDYSPIILNGRDYIHKDLFNCLVIL